MLSILPLAALALAEPLTTWSTPAVAADIGGPALGSLVVGPRLAGFTSAPSGPTNGPLSATEFASQSADPPAASARFSAVASLPGFGAFIRLWSDVHGPDHGANDIAVLLFRIPGAAETRSFFSTIGTPFGGPVTTTAFTVPDVPGARGYSARVTAPSAASEQVVVLDYGEYVAMIQQASTIGPSNPTPLTSADAVAMAQAERSTLAAAGPGPAGAPSGGPPEQALVGARSPAWVLVAFIVILEFAAVAGLLFRRRSGRTGSGRLVPAGGGTDPWGPDGILALFGGRDPADFGHFATVGGGDAGGSVRLHARSVPATVPAVPPSVPPAQVPPNAL